MEDPEIARMVSAAVGDGGLGGLRRITAAIDQLERARTSLINVLRQKSVTSWEEIGGACGMTRQGAQRRWAKEVQASSFGAAADVYARGRPSHPTRALDWLLPPGARRALDVGAGTGQLARLLVARGLQVTAVEPSPEMRHRLLRGTPGATVLAGAAEDIPLPDASVDVVLVAQAWHWVDHQKGVAEVARVLVPGGRLGLLWNVRDERVGWVARLGQIMRCYTHQDGDTTPTLFPPFEHVEHYEVSWVHQLTPAQLIDLVSSRSYVITLSDDQRESLLADIRELLATEPALADRSKLELPYLTQCTRAHRDQ